MFGSATHQSGKRLYAVVRHATGGLLPPGGGYCRIAAHREAMPATAVSLQFIA